MRKITQANAYRQSGSSFLTVPEQFLPFLTAVFLFEMIGQGAGKAPSRTMTANTSLPDAINC